MNKILCVYCINDINYFIYPYIHVFCVIRKPVEAHLSIYPIIFFYVKLREYVH